MIRATTVRGQHPWTQAPADTVVLDFDDRHRRRMAMTGTRGLEFLLDLENAVALRGGDALVLEDGKLIEVVARAEGEGEPVAQVDAVLQCDAGDLAVDVADERHEQSQRLTGGRRDPMRRAVDR